ncbi:protein HGV2-like isoform X2 [Mangifera indica]|uniref:protein HGV2-like isoform X2 n=1 Tax=Mangifera indica TaxID=29780 RepID=UPI001CF9FBE3|nr:protein HGV2-like isoform X2 [Mangifera indica]
MAEEDSVTVTVTEGAPKSTESVGATRASVEATIQSLFEGGIDSISNEDGETSGVPDDGDEKERLEFSDELIGRGTKALEDKDFGEAAECFSRALEIRVALYGELAPECLKAYYQYGRALLYRAQEEADPLVSVPKKDDESELGSHKDKSVKNVVNGESSTASASTNTQLDESSNKLEETENEVSGGKGKEEDEECSDQEDMAEADEDESDLDLAWKTLDVARAIAEKHLGDTLEKVDILSTLAEVSLEREDFETSLSDYQNALSLLVQLVEPDSRRIAELNFRICLCLEIGSKPQEAIPYCEEAISVCKSRVVRLENECRTLSQAASLTDSSEQSSNEPVKDKILADMKAEIETLMGLLGDLEKKREDLQQQVMNPKLILAELLAMTSAKGKDNEKGSLQMGSGNGSGKFDSPTASSSGQSNGAVGGGVTHLGIVGRGVKRVSMSSGSGESSAMKKPTVEHASNREEGDKN